MASIRDRLLAVYLGCEVEELDFLDDLDVDDERWDDIVEGIFDHIYDDFPGIELVKDEFEKKSYSVVMEVHEIRHTSMVIWANNEKDAEKRVLDLMNSGCFYDYDVVGETVEVIEVCEEESK